MTELALLLPSQGCATNIFSCRPDEPRSGDRIDLCLRHTSEHNGFFVYYLDDQLAATATHSPFWMGSQAGGFSLETVAPVRIVYGLWRT